MDTINGMIVAFEGGVLGYALTTYYLKGDKRYVRLALVLMFVIAATAAAMGV